MTARRSFGPYSVDISNQDKPLFPDSGLTKGELIAYYDRISEHILPHLKDRPLVLQRFPDGIAGEGFYQKQRGEQFPDWIRGVGVDVRSSGGHQELVVCDNKATLVYLANQACLTLHPWLSRTRQLERPDLLLIDLDPPSDDFEQVRLAALWVRDLLQDLGLVSFPKLTGSRGLHVAVPLDRSADFEAARGFARAAMELLASRHAGQLTTEQRKDKRAGRLYLDTGRNAYAQTAVAPWSVRPLPRAPVAAPLSWDELEQPGIAPRDYDIKNVFRRLGRRGDPWAGMRRHQRSLGRARERLQHLGSA
jgi:bifunctional non-homologous end joining protein LigD